MSAITFSAESQAHYSVFSALAEREYVVNIEYADGVVGFPDTRCMVVGADDDGITVCELDLGATPIRNSTWHIGYDEFERLVIL